MAKFQSAGVQLFLLSLLALLVRLRRHAWAKMMLAWVSWLACASRHAWRNSHVTCVLSALLNAMLLFGALILGRGSVRLPLLISKVVLPSNRVVGGYIFVFEMPFNPCFGGG